MDSLAVPLSEEGFQSLIWVLRGYAVSQLLRCCCTRTHTHSTCTYARNARQYARYPGISLGPAFEDAFVTPQLTSPRQCEITRGQYERSIRVRCQFRRPMRDPGSAISRKKIREIYIYIYAISYDVNRIVSLVKCKISFSYSRFIIEWNVSHVG